MANTFTAGSPLPVFNSLGNGRGVGGTLTMTDGPGGVDLGLVRVHMGSVTPQTVTTGGYGTVFNTASGNVHVYSCASGDTFQVLAFGV